MSNKEKSAVSQSDRFKAAARELGADENDAAFDATLRKVAVHKPVEPPARTEKTKPRQKV